MTHDVYVDPDAGGWAGYRARCRTCHWTGGRRMEKGAASTDAKQHAALAINVIPQSVDLWVCAECGRAENAEFGLRPQGEVVVCNRHDRPFPTMTEHRYRYEVPLNVWT